MRVNRGIKKDIITGDRITIFCEGGKNSLDIVFYKTILGANANKFDLKPIGSSNTLLCFAETNLINNGFCLIDKDFRTDKEVSKLESKYNIKFLKVHEIENFLLDINYLEQLEYIRININIKNLIFTSFIVILISLYLPPLYEPIISCSRKLLNFTRKDFVKTKKFT